MPLNLPFEVWMMLVGAGALFTVPLILVYMAYRSLLKRSD
jgi:hypothetical protein